MCGRYASFLPAEAIARMFGTGNPLPNLAPSTWLLSGTSSRPTARSSSISLLRRWRREAGRQVNVAGQHRRAGAAKELDPPGEVEKETGAWRSWPVLALRATLRARRGGSMRIIASARRVNGWGGVE